MSARTRFSGWWQELLSRVYRVAVSPVVAVAAPRTSRDLKQQMRLRSRCFWVPCLALVCVTLPMPRLAHASEAGSTTAEADQATPNKTVRSNTVTGTVTAVTKRSLSVEYAQSTDPVTHETTYDELLLPFGADIKLDRIASLSELKQGDTVSVGFLQTYRQDEKGNPVLMKTTVTSVALVKTGSQGLSSRGAQAP